LQPAETCQQNSIALPALAMGGCQW
jgi:hypothetical protein